MPKVNVGETVGGMFDDLKSKLGFNGGNDEGGYDAPSRGNDAYDEYSDFDEFSEYGESYDENAHVGGYRPLTAGTSSRSSRYSSSDISSSLVSINDVKASTPYPDLPSRGSSAYGRPLADAAVDSSFQSESAPSTPTIPAFNPPTEGIEVSYREAAPGVTIATAQPQGQGLGAGGYSTYANPGSMATSAGRSLTVVKPASYSDVELVARAVKSGNVVVLAMHETPDDLSKRVLDFSFGVASALDANVECPGDKVFAIARGTALTPAEKSQLAMQGVLR